ncbi:hypothetical protein [Streptomyces sp. SID3343]|uniref:hypothetical protein n=1 Tax=Streptomyces sp. SID3343 TaxID=2690260 RepID=UPI001367B5BC|nr:hypothetical protein [Streptomyces sp. SID3343]MYW05640.1 hypothetical protein [Streptomyces sp. SID3343]
MNTRSRAQATRKWLIPYPETRAVEHAAFVEGITPTGVFPVLLPVWSVEIRATVTEGKPYDLIDHYLERAIHEGHLDTVDGLARFLGLDAVLVDRALRSLVAIDHIVRNGDTVRLTELGRRSVCAGTRYVVTREDRRRLYFDAFRSRPLTRRYYAGDQVTLLSGADADHLGRNGQRFTLLVSTHGFARDALARLSASPERDRYNLPARIDEPQSLGEEMVFLPVYIVRGWEGGRGGRLRHLVYGQAGDDADPDLSAMAQDTVEIVSALASEQNDPERTRVWLREKHPTATGPEAVDRGGRRATFPPESFGPDASLSLTKVGSFQRHSGCLFQLWCADEETRRRALVERMDEYLGARSRPTRDDVDDRLARIAEQLELQGTDRAELRRLAHRYDRRDLAARLDELGTYRAH